MNLMTLTGRRKTKRTRRKVTRKPAVRKARKRRTLRGVQTFKALPKRRRRTSAVRKITRRRKAPALLGAMTQKLSLKSITSFLKPVSIGVGGVLVGNGITNKIISSVVPVDSNYTNEYKLGAKIGLALLIPRLWKKKAGQFAGFGLAIAGLTEYVSTKWNDELKSIGLLGGRSVYIQPQAMAGSVNIAPQSRPVFNNDLAGDNSYNEQGL